MSKPLIIVEAPIIPQCAVHGCPNPPTNRTVVDVTAPGFEASIAFYYTCAEHPDGLELVAKRTRARKA